MHKYVKRREKRLRFGGAIVPLIIGLLFLQLPGAICVAQAKPIRVLTSFLPVYIFTKNVVGKSPHVVVECLLPGHVDPHEYQMRPSDMRKIIGADLVILSGLGMEGFLTKTLAKRRAKGVVLESAEGLSLIPTEEEEEGHRHGEHRHDGEFNGHTWVSPEMAKGQVLNIARFLAEADPAGAAAYKRNAAAYVERLEALSAELKALLGEKPSKKVVTFHNAFDYLAREAGMEIAGVIYPSPGENPSAGDLASLMARMKKEKITIIFTEPTASRSIVGIVAKETGARVYTLDPLAMGKLDEGYYEEGMKRNIEILRKAFVR